jgi:osmoprotectant transport system ATP-binding protein
MLQLDQVSFQYQSHDVLSNVSLNLPEKQFHVILGPSGSGKSTLLKIVVGLLKPTRGQVNLVQDYGFILQEAGLFQHLSVAENIAIQGLQKKWPREKIDERLNELCRLTDFSETLLTRKPSEISGGQRQRVALMRALFMNVDLILMDEPFSALDPLLKYEILQQMKKLFKTLNKTVVLVTHDLFEASFFADTVTLLKNGQIVEHGTKKQFFESPQSEFAKKFIESQKPQ